MSALAGEGQGNLLFRGPDPRPGTGPENSSLSLSASCLPSGASWGRGASQRYSFLGRGWGVVDGEEGGSPSFCLGPAFLTLTLTPQRGRSPRQEGFFLLTRGSGLCLKA